MKIILPIFALFFFIAACVIRFTPENLALEHDARSYYDTAVRLIENRNILGSFFSSSSQFIDHGYPTYLAIIMRFVGTKNIIALQIANYVLWISAAWLIFKSLRLMKSKYAEKGAIMMTFSPLYLTFSGKVYSEPFACLGSSLIIYSIVSMLRKPSMVSKIGLAVGGIILFSTKSVLLPFIIPLGIYLIYKREFNYLIWLMVVPLVLFPSVLGSLGGGRSLYTLNIQSSKIEQSYDQIVACIPYYLSYPLGKTLLPNYQGVCHQNDAMPNMPGYESNPYVLADISRDRGFTYSDWIMRIVYNPIKYILILLVSLSNIILFEGIYPSILLLLPLPFMLLGFIVCKIFLSAYLWVNVWKRIKTNWVLGFPILYFMLVVTNFPVEPRYFYPFIPYMYFIAGLDINKGKLS